MFESEKSLLKRLCQRTNSERQSALETELRERKCRYQNMDGMALVVPSEAQEVTVLCAHFDAVPGSWGFNDNGMALVTVLELLREVPSNVEVLFTNYEERGALGAAYYIEHTNKKIKGCINLDVVGCFDQVYLDPMNCSAAKQLTNCKQGPMPLSDAHAFFDRGIPSICFSSGPAESSFRMGMKAICATLHNNAMDNKFELLNFEMVSRVRNEVKKVIKLMNAA